MSKRDLKAIISYLFDAVISNQEIPLTSSLPEEVQEDMRFASKLHKVDLSSESRIRQRLRNQLEKQIAMQQNAGQILDGVVTPGQTQTRHTGVAFLSVGLGAAAVVMTALLILLRSPERTREETIEPQDMLEPTSVETVSEIV